MQAKNNFSSGVIFNSNYLVEPNNCIYTHICATALNQPSRARNIQHKRLHTKGVQK